MIASGVFLVLITGFVTGCFVSELVDYFSTGCLASCYSRNDYALTYFCPASHGSERQAIVYAGVH
jgi:hypothetical protein